MQINEELDRQLTIVTRIADNIFALLFYENKYNNLSVSKTLNKKYNEWYINVYADNCYLPIRLEYDLLYYLEDIYVETYINDIERYIIQQLENSYK